MSTTKTTNMTAEMAIKIFEHFCKDTKQVRAYISEIADDLGLSAAQASRIRVRDLANFLERMRVPEKQQEEDGPEEWEWWCSCDKSHAMNSFCPECREWCCACAEDFVHSLDTPLCKDCGTIARLLFKQHA